MYVTLCVGAAVAEWLNSWLAEREERGLIPGLTTWIFRDWLSPASKSEYGWKIAKSTLSWISSKQPTNQFVHVYVHIFRLKVPFDPSMKKKKKKKKIPFDFDGTGGDTEAQDGEPTVTDSAPTPSENTDKTEDKPADKNDDGKCMYMTDFGDDWLSQIHLGDCIQ